MRHLRLAATLALVLAATASAAPRRPQLLIFSGTSDPESHLLVTLDPVSIGEVDVNPNPISWTREVEGGRVFYTAMGHTNESYSEPLFLGHLAAGIRWAAGR